MRRRGWRPALAVTALVALSAACSSGAGAPASARTTPTSITTSPTSPVAKQPTASPHGTLWLCRPDVVPNPCTASGAATAVAADGAHTVETQQAVTSSAGDCFYVYPTVSHESGRNADLRIQASERQVAFAQASRFSSACRVWAPMYRQRTTSDLFNLADLGPNSTANRVAYSSLRAAWLDYLAHDNHGRPVVLIGHSQGAAMLIRLIAGEIDGNPALRSRIALAIVLGGNVTVATGTPVGGSFQHIPLCTRPAQAGCVIAYSSFPGQPPIGAFFGRPGTGVSVLSGESASSGLSVACVNPADIGGGATPLHPYFPTALVHSGVLTPWTTYPDRYTSACRHGEGATWLQVSPTHVANDVRPMLPEELGTLWGFHVADVNLALGDLVADTRASLATWHRGHR